MNRRAVRERPKDGAARTRRSSAEPQRGQGQEALINPPVSLLIKQQSCKNFPHGQTEPAAVNLVRERPKDESRTSIIFPPTTMTRLLLLGTTINPNKGTEMKPLVKRFSFYVLAMATICNSMNSSYARDVFDRDSNEKNYIKVDLKKNSKSGKMQVGLKSCLKGQAESSCRTLGPKKFYDISALEGHREAAVWKIVGTSALDLYIITLATVGGGVAFATIAGANEAVCGPLMFLGGAQGAFISTKNILDGRALNPLKHYQEHEALNDDVILDRKVVVEDINEFTAHLESALNHID